MQFIERRGDRIIVSRKHFYGKWINNIFISDLLYLLSFDAIKFIEKRQRNAHKKHSRFT